MKVMKVTGHKNDVDVKDWCVIREGEDVKKRRRKGSFPILPSCVRENECMKSSLLSSSSHFITSNIVNSEAKRRADGRFNLQEFFYAPQPFLSSSPPDPDLT